MLKKKNILIVENEYWQYEIITRNFENAINYVCNVYPKLENWENLLNQIQQKEFTNVIELTKYVDIYVIDIHLYNNEDTLGVELAEEILRTKSGNYKIVLISNSPGEYAILDDEKVISFVKEEAAGVWAKELVNLVAEEILKMLKIEVSTFN